VRHAGRTLAVASPLAESPAESASRGHLHLARINPLALQARVIDSDGIERRLDFLLAPGLAGEVDGFVKYEGDEGRQAARKEKRRDLALQRNGMFTIRWSAEEAFWHPHRVIQVVRHALTTHSAIA
jgi:very-short-patch-repair endonuclease